MGVNFAFFKGKPSGFRGLLDGTIRWFMRGEYAHVETILSDNRDGTYLCASSVPGVGVRIANIPLPASDWDIVEGPGDVASAYAWFSEREGKAYDYVGLLGFVFRPIVGKDKKKYWCSEACLESIGFPDSWRYDPNSMHDVVTYFTKML